MLDSIRTKEHVDIGEVEGAFVSTAEPQFLSLCLDCFSDFSVHALMYQYDHTLKVPCPIDHSLQTDIVTLGQLSEVVAFAHKAIGAPEEWLNGYYTNLINRQELFAFRRSDRLLAIRECRGNDKYQMNYAGLGVIVRESERNKGIGSYVLTTLTIIANEKNFLAICSTAKDNVGAQKAIRNAGFLAGHRILRFSKDLVLL